MYCFTDRWLLSVCAASVLMEQTETLQQSYWHAQNVACGGTLATTLDVLPADRQLHTISHLFKLTPA